MFCPRCGNKINDDAVFCPGCGMKVREILPGYTQQSGGGQQGNSENRPYVRQPLQNPQQGGQQYRQPSQNPQQGGQQYRQPYSGNMPAQSPKNPNNGKKGLIAALVAVSVVMLAGIGILAFYLGNNMLGGGKSKSAQQTTEAAATAKETTAAATTAAATTAVPITKAATAGTTAAATAAPVTQTPAAVPQTISAQTLPSAPETAPSVIYVVPGQTSGGYILPSSGSRLLSASEVAGLSKDQLRLARNEIYARHGRIFDDQGLQAYFNSMSWYHGIYTGSQFSEDWLSEVEKKNIALIEQYEAIR